MKLGIYGGSFDPVHLGHLLVAQAAVEELGLDKLFFIPAAQSPFKPENKPAPDISVCNCSGSRWLEKRIAKLTTGNPPRRNFLHD